MNPIRHSFLQLAATLALGLVAVPAWADNPRETATVSFGAWMSSPPLDRFPNTSDTRFRNDHVITPNVATVKAGGTVNFIVSGFHNIAVYGNGIEPQDIDTSRLVTTTGTPNDIPIIDDADGRIYRGLDPTLQAVDRVEVVKFDDPGTYLVICGILPHFTAGMYGYVVVLP
jgi:plastocyanin